MTAVKTLPFLDTLNECIASIDAPTKQTKNIESKVLEQIRSYFILASNSQDSNGLSEDDKEMIDFMKSNLQYLTLYPDSIRINAYQLKNLFELQPDADMLLLLSTYYACFYLADTLSESILTKKKRLVDELLCIVYHEITLELIKRKKSYDDYFSYHIIKQLRTSTNSKQFPAYHIISNIATKYNLMPERIISFLEDSDNFYEITDNWPAERLCNYMKNKVTKNDATFADFLKENQFENLFNNDEVDRYESLFKSYVNKLIKGQIGTFHDSKNKSADVNQYVRNIDSGLSVEKKSTFPIDVFDACNIMIIWLDKYIGLEENCRELKNGFRQLTSNFKTESTVENCRKLLPSMTKQKIFFIIQGSLAKDIVPDIEQIIPNKMEPVVYLFCMDKKKYSQFVKNYESTKRGHIFAHQNDLFDQLQDDLNKYVLNQIRKYFSQIIPEEPATDFTRNIIRMSRQCCKPTDSVENSHKKAMLAN